MPLTDSEIKQLQQHARQLRLDIIDTTVWAGGAHIGGSLSMAEILVLLYFKVMKIDPKRPDWTERDRLVLSKGHGGVGLASVLAQRGYYSKELLREFNHFNSPFGMHLDGNKVIGVDASTGSLGHGLPMALGMAMGARHQGQAWRSYCILGDGECNEGSIWEAAMAAAHFKVSNLTAFLDRNRLMMDGDTEEIMALEPLADKWRAFGWVPLEVDGHDLQALAGALEMAHAEKSAPTIIIARTTKGKGVDFMENDVKWHYGSFDSELAKRARASVEKLYEGVL